MPGKIQFFDGSVCSENENQRYSSSVYLRCSTSGETFKRNATKPYACHEAFLIISPAFCTPQPRQVIIPRMSHHVPHSMQEYWRGTKIQGTHGAGKHNVRNSALGKGKMGNAHQQFLDKVLGKKQEMDDEPKVRRWLREDGKVDEEEEKEIEREKSKKVEKGEEEEEEE
eukprot:CAMPEP_0201535776 /NCGR_PEP_ID=MMETSP0161_2-20130828/59995_1 /ASSEMBLY_ACC=CAM_ASM_000251 /TAXON_ID=180227 /ORGANISM="Neoparamoeba aestuarina, Strain SoJaBio B1-5/56/2" /LENGTH=168 /DNA_ID=CAMNT_0047941131 /DNA_START=178 /DNA_END=681 /DNA_ORIENTATION=-